MSRLPIALAQRRDSSPRDDGFFSRRRLDERPDDLESPGLLLVESRNIKKVENRFPPTIRACLSRRLHVWLLIFLLMRRLIQVEAGEAEVSLRVRMRVGITQLVEAIWVADRR